MPENYKVKLPKKRKDKYVCYHKCERLKYVEDAEVRRFEHQKYFDFAFDGYEFYVSIEYCPYCGVELLELDYA